MTIEFPQISGYRFESLLGQGGMASVYLATQDKLNRRVAVKVLSPALLGDSHLAARFLNEAETAASLSHPHIVPIYDVGRDGYWVYIVMEYLQMTLRDRIRAGSVSQRSALDIVRQMAEALDYAHRKGIVHRDIKPENIMFREVGTAVLVDFGIARAMGTATRMTQEGLSIGTPFYMSPEQARGLELDGRCDIYALGVVMYEMLTGKVPFDGQDAVAIISKHLQEPIPRLPRAHESFQPLMDIMLAKDRNDRVESGLDLLKRIGPLSLQETKNADFHKNLEYEPQSSGSGAISGHTPQPEFFGGYPCETIFPSGPATSSSEIGIPRRTSPSNLLIPILAGILVVVIGLLLSLLIKNQGQTTAVMSISDSNVRPAMRPRVRTEIVTPEHAQTGGVKSTFQERLEAETSQRTDIPSDSHDPVITRMTPNVLGGHSDPEPNAQLSARHSNALKTIRVKNVRIDLVHIPPGSFKRGSNYGSLDERPVREIKITKGFWIGKTELTQGQWKAVMKGNPSKFQDRNDYPVENVSWNDCQKFLRSLNLMTGKAFRLPTEAEWEYACLAGMTDEEHIMIDEEAWYAMNSGGATRPVAGKNPNAFGLYDMLGNVWEWVADMYSSEYYKDSHDTDPQGPLTGRGRVFRGGSWADESRFIRAACRRREDPSFRDSTLGVRLALDE